MKIVILLTLVILIAGSFKPNTNVLVGKWELFYLKTMSGGITKKGNDIPDTILFSEQTLFALVRVLTNHSLRSISIKNFVQII